MYDGQYLVCKDIVEEYWTDYLRYLKKKSQKDEEQFKKRQEVLKALEPACKAIAGVEEVQSACEPVYANYKYYDISLSGFWNWYITEKL